MIIHFLINKRRPALSLIILSILGFVACEDEIRYDPVCDPGYMIDDNEEFCVPVEQYKSCSGINAIGDQCRAESRICLELSPKRDSECGGCLPGFKEEHALCKAVLTCEALECESEYRSCNEALDHFDATCGDCLEGFTLTEGRCSQPSCDPVDTNSLYSVCLQQNKLCDNESLSCGECIVGYRALGDRCEQIQTCELIKKSECDPQLRGCFESADPKQDSYCGECVDGYEEVDGTCTPIPSAATCEDLVESNASETPPQIWADYCLERRRACIVSDLNPLDLSPGEANTVAECGDCLEGYALDPDTGSCVAVIPCDVLGCDQLNRQCEEGASFECGVCLNGFTQDLSDSDRCRPLITCDNLNCAELGTSCTPADLNSDAYCEVNCGQRAVFNGRECTPCPPCQGEGETGISRRLTSAGYCVCNTSLDHFYSTSGEVGTFPCDADGDGWLRENARLAMESDDPILRSQAKCTLQKVHSIKLRNEKGEERLVALPRPIGLYETLRNDDQQILERFWSELASNLQFVNQRALQASSLNRLTKLCFERAADFNDNGVEDVSEWGSMPLSPTMRTEQRVFNEFSYFVELHNGYFEEDRSFRAPLDSEGEVYGVYVIEERDRESPTNLFEGIQLNSEGRENKYWRECTLREDIGWGGTTPEVGLDLSGQASEEFSGMHLHSLFKCLYITETPDEEIPTQRTPSEAEPYDGLLNECHPSSVGSSGSGDRVSDRLSFECDLVNAADANGKVLWAIEPYQAYFDADDYQRGCINECTAEGEECEGEFVTCRSSTENFGKKLGCEYGEICDGIDNDQDNRIDEGLPRSLSRCQTTLPGQCSEGRIFCLPRLDDSTTYQEVCVPDEQIRGIDIDTPTPYIYCQNSGATGCVIPKLKLGFTLSDLDRDGTIEARDNCPGVSNPDQSDRDRDGVGDLCDRESSNYPELNFRPKLIVSDLKDSDHDGILDHEDACPSLTGIVCDLNPDGDGFGANDLCPDRYSVYNVDSDRDGQGNACDPQSQRSPQDFIQVSLNLSVGIIQFISENLLDPRDANYYTGQQDQLIEYCNNIDDDCDGRIDEGPIYDDPNNSLYRYPQPLLRVIDERGFGIACDVPPREDHPMHGICKEGHWMCSQGALICQPDHDIETIYDRTGLQGELTCDHRDDDCDNEIDEPSDTSKFNPGDLSVCASPHSPYYIDSDRDGYGSTAATICACDYGDSYQDQRKGKEQALRYATNQQDFFSNHPETSRPNNVSAVTQRSGDCCDINVRARPNQTSYSEDELPEQCIVGPLTHDWNCDGQNEDQGFGIDTSSVNERRYALSDIVGGNWRWVYSPERFTELGRDCDDLLRNGILYAIGEGGGTQYYKDNSSSPFECVKLWVRQEPLTCGDRQNQVEYLLFNQILYALPINARYVPKKCR